MIMSPSESTGPSLKPKERFTLFAFIQRMAISPKFERAQRYYATLVLVKLVDKEGMGGLTLSHGFSKLQRCVFDWLNPLLLLASF
jgi:hypothetical protein